MSDANHAPRFVAPEPEALQGLIAGYQFESLIAVGGMGAVYRARQTSLDRPVAIKLLPEELGDDGTYRHQFETEAKAMARLNHPNLVGVYDFGEVAGLLFIVMELVEGESLYHAAYGKVVSEEDAVKLISGICRGLQHAHENGVLHRDIKPSNILLDPNGRPKVADFGLAQAIKRDPGAEEAEGEIFGTPHYTAPEVIDQPDAVNERADIFSVGVILHEILTAQLPANDPRPASAISGTSKRMDLIIAKATQPNPSHRYSSAAEMADDLENPEASPKSRLLQTAASPQTAGAIHKVAAKTASPGTFPTSQRGALSGKPRVSYTSSEGSAGPWIVAILVIAVVVVLVLMMAR